MNVFKNVLDKYEIERTALCQAKLTTLQVNMGDLCNEACTHCMVFTIPSWTRRRTKFIFGYHGKT